MRKFYITTALPYVNASPHLGFALEVVQADVLARYHRLLGERTFFLTGTDEHGAKIAKAAAMAKKDVRTFVDENAKKFLALMKALQISNDDFIRTSDRKRHWPAVQKAWLTFQKRGDLYKKTYQGLYCVGHEAFITRKDLKKGKCVLHGTVPETIQEENYFFRLSKYTEPIKKAIASDTIRIVPQSRKREILALAKKGFEDVSFSRPRKDLQWGVPVPNDGSQTIYVWGDALLNYISSIGYAKKTSRFRTFWPANVHCIGKDILRFHAAIWPGMLLSLGLPLPKTIFVHGFITVGGQKMSKSLGNVVDPFELIARYGVDSVRYYLLREIPPTEDGDFTYEKFKERYNADLANGLGNLVARVIALAMKYNTRNQKSTMAIQNGKLIQKSWLKYKKALEAFRFNEALEATWALVRFCDRYIDRERPWENANNQSTIKNQKVVYNLLFFLGNIASMLRPFMPETSLKIFQQLGIRQTDKRWIFRPKKDRPLFPRLVRIS
jgi:methionyl-tRNA synthetase